MSGHLGYYKSHGISPVRYRVESLAAHFERREALYRGLGLPAIAFKGSRVLEVAPGSGQNSLYVAACAPASFDLVEPNPAALPQIEAAFAGLERPHTRPTVHPLRLEDFDPRRTFDIVICENWLGALPRERALIRRLSALVAEGGVLVITTVPPSGFFPNVMRRLLADRLAARSSSFEARTETLVEAFAPHLATIAGMTRGHRDWVHDCMINPHYLNVVLPLATLLETIGAEMEMLSTNPRYAADWRWFKALNGAARGFNDHFIRAERENLHNFIDHRRVYPPRPAADNLPLERAFDEAHRLAVGWREAHERGESAATMRLAEDIAVLLDTLTGLLRAVDPALGAALDELGTVWRRATIAVDDVRGMSRFGALFGRETVYVSLTRRPAA